jgi:hypothetical protein
MTGLWMTLLDFSLFCILSFLAGWSWGDVLVFLEEAAALDKVCFSAVFFLAAALLLSSGVRLLKRFFFQLF